LIHKHNPFYHSFHYWHTLELHDGCFDLTLILLQAECEFNKKVKTITLQATGLSQHRKNMREALPGSFTSQAAKHFLQKLAASNHQKYI